MEKYLKKGRIKNIQHQTKTPNTSTGVQPQCSTPALVLNPSVNTNTGVEHLRSTPTLVLNTGIEHQRWC